MRVPSESVLRPWRARLWSCWASFRTASSARTWRGCKGLIQTCLEDFGITPVEAQATGRPVVAYGAGGALETVVHGETGLLFPEQTVESLMDALERMESLSFDKEPIRAHAMRFSRARFLQEYSSFVSAKSAEASHKPFGRQGLSSEQETGGSGLVQADLAAGIQSSRSGQADLDSFPDKGDQGR